MNKHDEFKKAYDDYPSQDNEGFVPDRSGFKCGFFAAWDLLDGDSISKYKEALLKIYDPMKYHHWEEDAYTRAGCFQFVAQQALFYEEKKKDDGK